MPSLPTPTTTCTINAMNTTTTSNIATAISIQRALIMKRNVTMVTDNGGNNDNNHNNNKDDSNLESNNVTDDVAGRTISTTE